ncbi:hypothetical protein ACFO8O_11250 [Hephaestia sp. GCM10023244]|uniref:hypothetical protein n=1 Tax=unclassified Hephaestia TaxID=2631281 RepID=UPI0020773295|nr:hypothetical protein [Hephaestia sp. MAHUQ-44]MCM8731534.1 hypothetical protein [Hephaestia sp. MAHUQ-44]
MATPCSDGISEDDACPRSGYRRRARVAPLVILTVFLILGFVGLFGGRASPTQVAESDAARLEVTTPVTLRNGLVFETVIRATPKRPIKDLTLAISTSLWRDVTINSLIPAATQEESRDGFFRFSYGPVEAGQSFEAKLDGQINPPLFLGTVGDIVVYDGDVRLVGLETVRRQNIRHNSRRRLAECGPRQGVDVRRRTCGAASADVRWSVA